MASSTNPHITDELLSAYIDNAVTEDERRQVESAVAADPGVAWRLESLRHTVHLLNHLPELAAPRAFALTVEAVSAQPMQRRSASAGAPSRRRQPVAEPVSAGFDGFWQTLFQGGNLFLRNAAAGAALVFLMLVGANFVLPNLQNIELSRTATTSTTNAYPGPAIASTQPLATLTQVINAASDAPAVEATPESIVVQPANAQAPIAQSADEPATEPEGQSADAPAVAMQSAVSADANADDGDLKNPETNAGQAAPPAVAKQSALAVAADQPVAPEAASQPRNAPPVATPLPQATTAPEMGVGGEAAASEMVTASSVISEQEAPLAAMSVAQADAPPEPAAGQSAELALAPAAPSTADESAVGAASADESVADADMVEEAAPVLDDEESADIAVAEEEAVESSEAYAAADSPLVAPVAEEGAANSVAQAPAPAPIEQPPAADAASAAGETAPIVAEAPSEAQPAVQRSLNAPVANRVNADSLLWYAQIMAALCTLGFTLLWWRSRG